MAWRGVDVRSMREVSQVSDHLYVCGLCAAQPNKCLEMGITLLIDASNMPPLDIRRTKYDPSIKIVQITLNDEEHAPISDHFDELSELILETKKSGGKSLVHCYAGASRSTTICMAYLVKCENMTLKEAAMEVKRARYQTCPNPGFWKQLIEYERKIRGEASVKMIGSCADVFVENAKNNLRALWEAYSVHA